MFRHILPIGDSQPHQQQLNCPCNPMLQEGDEFDLVVHQFFNGTGVVLQAELAMHMRCEDCGHYMSSTGEHCPPPEPYYEYDHEKP